MIRYRATHADNPPPLPPEAPAWSSDDMRRAMLEHKQRCEMRMQVHDTLPRRARDLNNVVMDAGLARRLMQRGCRTEADVRRVLGWNA